MSLITVGTIALDNIKTAAGERKDMLGGSVSHFAMSARLFTKVHLAGVIGKDFPAHHISFFKKKGIDVNSVIESEGNSFRWTGEYKKGDFNTAITIATELGALSNYVPQIHVSQRDIPNVFLANIDPDIQSHFLTLLKKPKFIGLDSMNLWIDIKRPSLINLMKKVHLFVANDGEAKALTGETNLIKAAKTLRKMGPSFIVIKKGEHGVLFYSDKFMFSFPAFPVEEVVDPTGAGDTFAGAIMGYLAKVDRINEKSLKQALLYATTLSSYNVESFGTEKTSKLTLAQVHQRMRKYIKFFSIK